MALGGEVRAAGTVTRPSGSASGVPKRSTAWGTSVATTSTSASTVRGEQGRAEVLVDDGLDAAQGAVGVPDDGDAAAAVGDDDEAGLDQRVHGRRVEDLQRLRRGDDPAPALLAAVLPRLAVLDQHRASSRGGGGRWAWWAG